MCGNVNNNADSQKRPPEKPEEQLTAKQIMHEYRLARAKLLKEKYENYGKK